MIAQILGGLPANLDCLPVERETLLELTALGQGVTLVTGSAAAVFHPGVAYRPIHGADGAVIAIVPEAVDVTEAWAPSYPSWAFWP